MDAWITLVPLFFLTAVLYASAGFGGGSTYLALLVLFGFSYAIIPQIALVCNLVVVTSGFVLFARSGHFSWRRGVPFVVLSIPAAYIGGTLPIAEDAFFLLLGVTLFVAGTQLLWSSFVGGRAPKSEQSETEPATASGLFLGAGIGFLSGVVGIGGGIFLAPILYFLRWGTARQIAALASFFILVNSASGLAGQVAKSGLAAWSLELALLPVAVFFGGQVGSRLAITRFSPQQLQRITSVLILLVSLRILWGLL